MVGSVGAFVTKLVGWGDDKVGVSAGFAGIVTVGAAADGGAVGLAEQALMKLARISKLTAVHFMIVSSSRLSSDV
jgi:hypothetical protein